MDVYFKIDITKQVFFITVKEYALEMPKKFLVKIMQIVSLCEILGATVDGGTFALNHMQTLKIVGCSSLEEN